MNINKEHFSIRPQNGRTSSQSNQQSRKGRWADETGARGTRATFPVSSTLSLPLFDVGGGHSVSLCFLWEVLSFRVHVLRRYLCFLSPYPFPLLHVKKMLVKKTYWGGGGAPFFFCGPFSLRENGAELFCFSNISLLIFSPHFLFCLPLSSFFSSFRCDFVFVVLFSPLAARSIRYLAAWRSL